jgi:pumilio homology domain family member 6
MSVSSSVVRNDTISRSDSKHTKVKSSKDKTKRSEKSSSAEIDEDESLTKKSSKAAESKKATGKRVRFADIPKDESEDEEIISLETTEAEEPAPKIPRSQVSKQAKELRKERRASKPDFEEFENLKPLWEKLRQKSIPESERAALMNELHSKLSNKYMSFATKKEGSRVVELALKLGSKEQRLEILNEFGDNFVELAKGRYSKHIVTQIFKQNSSLKVHVAKQFEGKMLSCLKNSICAPIVDLLYADCCNQFQRNNLMLEFYGKEFVLFRKTYEGQSLSDILAKDPSKKSSIVPLLRKTLDDLLKKGETSLHHSVIHRLLRDYLTFADVNEDLLEWMNDLLPNLKQIIHTMDGVLASLRCLTLGNAKARKRFIKSLYDKESLTNDLPNVLIDQFAHIVLMGVFTLVDDTVLVNDTIIKELLKDFDKMASHKYASQLILFLFAGGRSRYLTEPVFKALEQADQSTTTSKKPMDIRINQLREPLEGPFINYAKGRVIELMKDPGVRSSLLLEFLLLPAASETLLAELVELLSQPSSSNHPVVEDHCRSFMKKLVRRAPTEEMVVRLFESLRVNLKSWLSLDAIYVIVAMGQCSSKVKGMLKGETKVLELIESVPNHSTKHSQK